MLLPPPSTSGSVLRDRVDTIDQDDDGPGVCCCCHTRGTVRANRGVFGRAQQRQRSRVRVIWRSSVAVQRCARTTTDEVIGAAAAAAAPSASSSRARALYHDGDVGRTARARCDGLLRLCSHSRVVARRRASIVRGRRCPATARWRQVRTATRSGDALRAADCTRDDVPSTAAQGGGVSSTLTTTNAVAIQGPGEQLLQR